MARNRCDDGTPYLETRDRGGPYPDGTVTHIFNHPGKHTIHLQVTWQASYLVTDPQLPTLNYAGEAPLDQANEPEFTVNVVEARAVLVS